MIKNVKLRENILWVGKVDDREVPFHRLALTKGTTYNSYLLMSEKPTIIDTVDISFGREYVENLKSIIDLESISYIVINHTEPDHSGGLISLAANAKNAVIVCTRLAEGELKEMYKLHNREFLIVGDGDTLDIGGKTLKFFETPYLHTEETMVTYVVEDKILFSCDIFSTHVANYDYFNDLSDVDIKENFIGYYKLIMHPHRRYVQDMISKLEHIDVDMIAPSHGFIIRENVKSFINIYDSLSKASDKGSSAVIIYSSMTGRTKVIADLFKDKFEENHISSRVINVNNTPREKVLEEVKRADAIFFGSSTRYADMIGDMENILKDLGKIDLTGKVAAAFGSYGWSGEAIEVIQGYLNSTNMKVLSTSDIIKTTGMVDVEFPVRIRFSPGEKETIMIEKSARYASELLNSKL